MSNARDFIGFTLDIRKFINCVAQDPTAKAEIIAGLQDAPNKLTEALGAANLSPGDDTENVWCTLFPATVQGKGPGEEFLYRNNSHEGDGTRIQMRLRRQPKRNALQDEAAAKTAPTTTPGAALPAGVDPAVIAASNTWPTNALASATR